MEKDRYSFFSDIGKSFRSDSAPQLHIWVLGGVTVLMCSIIAPPILAAAGISEVIISHSYIPFHQLCHQVAERSFAFNGVPLAVCARCLGIFAGFWVALMGLSITSTQVGQRISTKASIYLLLGILSLHFLQFFIEHSMGLAGSNAIRFSLGLGLGAQVIFVIYSGNYLTSTNSLIQHGTAPKTDIL